MEDLGHQRCSLEEILKFTRTKDDEQLSKLLNHMTQQTLPRAPLQGAATWQF